MNYEQLYKIAEENGIVEWLGGHKDRLQLRQCKPGGRTGNTYFDPFFRGFAIEAHPIIGGIGFIYYYGESYNYDCKRLK